MPSAKTVGAVFEQEFPYVFHTLRRLGVAERDLEDLTHEVFVIFYRRVEAYDADRPLRPWLFGIAYRLASRDKTRLRATREAFATEHDPEPRDEAPSADDQLDLHRRRQLVLDALDTLAADRKAILIMHDIDGIAMPDIAATLDVPLNTAYSRLRLAREAFKTAVQRRSGGGER